MLLTAVVFQLPISWLNVFAPANIYVMVLTAPVFQLPMFALKSDLDANSDDISVTWLVSQDVMGSYTAAPHSTTRQSHAPLLTLLRQLSRAIASAKWSANGPGPSQALAGPSVLPSLAVRLYRANQAVLP